MSRDVPGPRHAITASENVFAGSPVSRSSLGGCQADLTSGFDTPRSGGRLELLR
jgi:hypothetical protein